MVSFHFLFIRFVFFLLLGDRGGVLVRHLALDTDKVGDFAIGIAQRRDKELIPKRRTVDTVIQQADGHVIALFNRLANAFDVLGVGFGALQEAAIASENLVERVSRQVEEALRGVNNRIVGQRWVRHDKVLLRSLQRLDETEIGIVQHLVGNALTTGEKSVDIVRAVLLRRSLVEQRFRLVVAQMRANGTLEFLVLFLEQCDRLLQRFEQKLFANARALCVFAIAFTVVV
jgi:hypothetical protein